MTGIWHRVRGGNAPGLTCIELVELVTDYLEGGLSDDERERFEAHLGECEACANYLDQIRQTIAVVGRVEPEDISDEAKAELLAAFQGWTRD